MRRFSGLGKKLGNFADNASKKSGELVEAARLNAEINRLQADIEDLQFELGRAYYEENKDNPDGPFAEIIKQILRKEHEVFLRNEKLLAQKGLMYCPGCGTVTGMDDGFCSKCGVQLPGINEGRQAVCLNCSEPLQEGQTHCAKCGFKVD